MRQLTGPQEALDDVSTPLHAARRGDGQQRRTALPGLQSVSLDTSPSGAETPGRARRLPDAGHDAGVWPTAPTGQRVGGDTLGRKDTQEPAPPEHPVPGVQPTRTYRHGEHTFTTPPQSSLQAALATARLGEWWRLASYQADAGCYLVPSKTTPGERYVVTLRAGATRDDPWWWRYECTCKATTSGKYLACWHKAACHYRRENLKSKLKVGLPAILNGVSVNHED